MSNHKSQGRPEGQAGGQVYSICSQRSQPRAVVSYRAVGAEAGAGRIIGGKREKGMAKVPGVCSEVGQPVPVCQPREKSLQRERLKYPERREV